MEARTGMRWKLETCIKMLVETRSVVEWLSFEATRVA